MIGGKTHVLFYNAAAGMTIARKTIPFVASASTGFTIRWPGSIVGNL